MAAKLPPLLAALLLAGCFGWGRDGGDEPPEPVFVEPPEDGGGEAPCASQSAQQLTLGFRSEAVADAGGLPPGLHRTGERTFVWVWAAYNETLRQDRVSRVSEVQAFREPDGLLVLCTRVNVLAPLEVDGRRRTYDVAARYTSERPLPEEERMRFVVNWAAGCGPCGKVREGNATARFGPP